MLPLYDNYQSGIVESFNSTSRYLYDMLLIGNHYFEQMVSQIYPIVNFTEFLWSWSPFFDLELSITNAQFHLQFTTKGMILILK